MVSHYRINDDDMAGASTIKLEIIVLPSCPMSKDAIINSRDIGEESIGSNDLVETREVGGRKPGGLEVFS